MPMIGDLILTSDPASWLAKRILIAESFHTGRPALWSHACRYIGQDPQTGAPMVLSQEWRLVAKPLAALTGRVRAWHNPAYSEAQRQALVAEASKYQGSLYDWLGIGGQMLRMVPVVGPWLTKIVQFPWSTFCSEREFYTEQTVDPHFGAGYEGIPSPEGLNTICRLAGWKCEDLA